jgi:hypothetical protein
MVRTSPLSRRQAGLDELHLDQTQAGPHDVGLIAAVAVLLAPVGAAQAVVVAGSFKKLGESPGFVEG